MTVECLVEEEGDLRAVGTRIQISPALQVSTGISGRSYDACQHGPLQQFAKILN